MSILTHRYTDLIEANQAVDAFGGVVPYAQVLTQRNPIMVDAVYNECNTGNGFVYNTQQALPESTWTGFYTGVKASMGKRTQVTAVPGALRARSEVDSNLLEQSNNPSALRFMYGADQISGMSNEFSHTFFYGDIDKNPAAFNGLSKLYNDPAAPVIGNQIINAGGSGSSKCTSIYFVGWGSNKTSLIHPRGTMAGLTRKNESRENITDTVNGGTYYAEVETFNWNVGLAVCDFRYVVRIGGINMDSVIYNTIDIYDYLRKAYYKFEAAMSSDPGVTSAIYMTREVKQTIDAQATNDRSSWDNYIRMTPMEIQGKMIDTYRGIPIRTVDALRVDEKPLTS